MSGCEKKLSKLLRGGRIGSARKDAVEFTASIKSDKKLLEAVIKINKAHVTMPTEQQSIPTKTSTQLLKALSEIDPNMELDPSLEDVHLAVEEEINKKLKPEIAGNLHVAKSRNDQVATAIRMALRTQIIDLIAVIVDLQE